MIYTILVHSFDKVLSCLNTSSLSAGYSSLSPSLSFLMAVPQHQLCVLTNFPPSHQIRRGHSLLNTHRAANCWWANLLRQSFSVSTSFSKDFPAQFFGDVLRPFCLSSTAIFTSFFSLHNQAAELKETVWRSWLQQNRPSRYRKVLTLRMAVINLTAKRLFNFKPWTRMF